MGSPSIHLRRPALEKELKRVVRGEVRFDRGSRAMYAADGSNYRQVPIGLVIPRDDDDVIAAVAACKKFGAPFCRAVPAPAWPGNPATLPSSSISRST